MRLKWTELAQYDLEETEVYVAEDNSPSIAIDLILTIIETVELILPRHPDAGRVGRVVGTRELVVNTIPFIIVYKHLKELPEIQILRILHDAQKWPV